MLQSTMNLCSMELLDLSCLHFLILVLNLFWSTDVDSYRACLSIIHKWNFMAKSAQNSLKSKLDTLLKMWRITAGPDRSHRNYIFSAFVQRNHLFFPPQHYCSWVTYRACSWAERCRPIWYSSSGSRTWEATRSYYSRPVPIEYYSRLSYAPWR